MSGPKYNKTVANLQGNDVLPMLLKQPQLRTGPTVKILPVTLVIEYRVIALFPDDEDIWGELGIDKKFTLLWWLKLENMPLSCVSSLDRSEVEIGNSGPALWNTHAHNLLMTWDSQ